MKPLVGISLGYHDGGDYLAVGYHRPVAAAGGAPVTLSRVAETVEEALERIDALVLAGGRDIEPQRYGQVAGPLLGATDPVRDAFELELVHHALDRGLPVLGICRGMQILASWLRRWGRPAPR